MRQYYQNDWLDRRVARVIPYHGGPIIRSSPDKANLVSSLLVGRTEHSPVLDLDFECKLIPSSTQGHYHLYLDGIELNWDQYKELLIAFSKAGIISWGYLSASMMRGMTLVRKPGVSK